MSEAESLYVALMEVIVAQMQDHKCGYTDVFGALAVCKAFFEVEYATKLGIEWREAIKIAEEHPEVMPDILDK